MFDKDEAAREYSKTEDKQSRHSLKRCWILLDALGFSEEPPGATEAGDLE